MLRGSSLKQGRNKSGPNRKKAYFLGVIGLPISIDI
jgi:hypothetical protein